MLASILDRLPEGSSTWAMYFFAVCLVFFLLSLLTGYREGFARQLYSLGALVAALLAAFFLERLFMPLFDGIGHPELLMRMYGGAFAAFIAFVVVYTIGRYSTTPARKIEDEQARKRSRRAGLLVGGVFGLLSVVILTSMTRFLGGFAIIAYSMFLPPKDRSAEPGRISINEPQAVVHTLEIPPLIHFFVKLRQSIDETVPGRLLLPLDIVPGAAQRSLIKAADIVNDPIALDYLMNDPEVLDLREDPLVLEVSSDPEVARAFEEQGVLGVLTNPKVRELIDNDDFASRVSALPVEELLDRALEQSGR